MNREEFSSFRNAHYNRIAQINDEKGHDYAGDQDALANFKDAAEKLGVSPFQVWAVYHHKHQSAIDTFVREGKVQSEPIVGRIHDAILYLFLLLGLIEDGKPIPEVVPFSEPVFAAAGGGAPPQATPPATDVPGVEKAQYALGATSEGCQSTYIDKSTDTPVQCNRPANHGNLHWGRTSLGHALEWTDADAHAGTAF